MSDKNIKEEMIKELIEAINNDNPVVVVFENKGNRYARAFSDKTTIDEVIELFRYLMIHDRRIREVLLRSVSKYIEYVNVSQTLYEIFNKKYDE